MALPSKVQLIRDRAAVVLSQAAGRRIATGDFSEAVLLEKDRYIGRRFIWSGWQLQWLAETDALLLRDPQGKQRTVELPTDVPARRAA